MNNKRRKLIIETVNKIENVTQTLNNILKDERRYYDGMPENLQGSERGTDSENAQGLIESAIDSLEDAIMSLEEID